MIRTRENWTYGIINIPLLYGHNNRNGINPRTIIKKVAHNAKCYRNPYPALDKSQRYLWFESDTDTPYEHYKILDYFKTSGIDVYYHGTMKGTHYITLQLLPLNQYEDIIEHLKEYFDNGTFYYSLRIIPNKWQDEIVVWYKGGIEDNGSGHIKQLRYIQQAMNQPYVFNYNRTVPNTVQMLSNMFCISRYEFKGALKV